MNQRLTKSSVHDDLSDAAWAVAETPSEVAEIVRNGRMKGDPLVELTLANPDSDWNGRTLYIDPQHVKAVGPPYTGMLPSEE